MSAFEERLQIKRNQRIEAEEKTGGTGLGNISIDGDQLELSHCLEQNPCSRVSSEFKRTRNQRASPS